MIILDRELDAHRLAALQGRLGLSNQLMVQGLIQAMVLGLAIVAGDAGGDLRLGEELGEVQALGLPVVDGAAHA